MIGRPQQRRVFACMFLSVVHSVDQHYTLSSFSVFTLFSCYFLPIPWKRRRHTEPHFPAPFIKSLFLTRRSEWNRLPLPWTATVVIVVTLVFLGLLWCMYLPVLGSNTICTKQDAAVLLNKRTLSSAAFWCLGFVTECCGFWLWSFLVILDTFLG